jgi:hypothetical protein
MRYFISSHGCYTNRRKVNLKKVTLLFYARENECIIYNNKFLKAFCRESTNKRKEYKPLFKKRREYFQMEFSREENDPCDSYIYCCNTKERIYDFKNGDLLLSQVVDIVTLHNNTYSDSPIYLSMLTCNSECEEDGENYGRRLHRKSSFKKNFYPKNFTNKNREERARTSKKIRNTIPSLAVSKMQSRHTLKSGNTVLSNGKKIQVFKKDGKWYSEEGEINRKLVTYVPDIEPGTSVLYKEDLWTVEESDGAHLSIRNLKSRAEERVEARDVVALEY